MAKKTVQPKKKNVYDDPAFDLAPVRLSADETRTILRLAQANGKPIHTPYSMALADLGIVRRVVVKAVDNKKEIEEVWGDIARAVRARAIGRVAVGLEKIRKLSKPQREAGVELTDLGKQLARGISVRIASQRY